MAIPGYDPADVDRALERRLGESDRADLLTEAERREYEGGASLVDLLDESTIREILGESER